ncbi:probable transmembrane GTPase FZO-like, chloroplastic isoform X2 [Hevea brasiliensis]|uniref:probable transmembrane GTPase FZO-like, chloroplastic isoform X2 n=1 Tax=Hevea brasiliensis TaxID=3981 RepID=UPI0025D02CF9|nr:probable transmembrane GTPase FZO-like, chloroplastic isoform X2 [Hevea brasiliensis]
MTPFLPLHVSTSSRFLSHSLPFFTRLPRFKSPSHRTHHFPILSIANNPFQQSIDKDFPTQQQQQPRTLFPGGYKRPEIKVPNIVLQLVPDDVLSGDDALDFIDKAVSKWVGIVVLNGGDGSGKTLYEAACLLKSVVRDRARLLIGERVDIAAAVNASGVVLSDQGLPAIVARNMMMDSKSESIVLPLVARNVQNSRAALNASNSEGADFLIYGLEQDKYFDEKMFSGFADVKIPIFVIYASHRVGTSIMEGLQLLKSGAGGLVMSLEDLRLFNDESFSQFFNTASAVEKKTENEPESLNKLKPSDVENGTNGKKRVAGFVKLEDREKQLIETERSILFECINVIHKAAPQMKEVSLLIDAVSQLDEPFLLAIVGEFNSGKSTVINALLGERYLKEGVVPTTNEITFLRYSKYNSEEPQRCERHPDGQYICFLPAPILKEMNIVDTPGTNVILQRQQRLTEEFVPRSDLLLFVISADRPLTESEVDFLRYTQQWKKKVVFVLNKSDLYQNTSELEEAISFIKENTRNLLSTENVILYPVSARSALEAKLSAASDTKLDYDESLVSESHWKISSFYELERFLYSFLDGSTETGLERMKLKLETPIAIADRILSTCETLMKQKCQYAKQDLTTVTELIDSVKELTMKMEKESITWRRKTSLLKQLEEYALWLKSNSSREGKLYQESFEKRWPSFVNSNTQMHLETYELLEKVDDASLKVIENFSAGAASKHFEQEIRELYLGTFGGLGAAGLSASLLTSVLPTTLEDLLALGLCSAGGFIAISNFPSRKQGLMDKVSSIADGLAREIEEAMQKDLLETVVNLENFVKTIGKPYKDASQQRLDKLLDVQNELSDIKEKLRTLQVEIQNLHVS